MDDAEQRQWKAQTLDSHLRLGGHKAISYLPIQTITKRIGMSVDQYTQIAKNNGLHYRVFSADESCIQSGAVYVYEPEALQKILSAHIALLRDCGWPEGPNSFVDKIATHWLEIDHKMMPIVRAAFGDDLAEE